MKSLWDIGLFTATLIHGIRPVLFWRSQLLMNISFRQVSKGERN